jgi:hypothetical protein
LLLICRYRSTVRQWRCETTLLPAFYPLFTPFFKKNHEKYWSYRTNRYIWTVAQRRSGVSHYSYINIEGMALRTLKCFVADNTVTHEEGDDKILVVSSAGNLTQKDIIKLMLNEYTGLHAETLEHVVVLYDRIVAEQITAGFAVNTGLFHAVAQPRGTIRNLKWDPSRNYVYVSFVQGKALREAIAETNIEIIGAKGDSMFIAGGEDNATQATNGTATSGRNYTLHGRMLKVVGDHESVGVTITSHTSGTVTKLTNDRLALNNPSQVMVLLPELADGVYTLTVTTQYSQSNILLKTPRSVSKDITIGQVSGDEGGESGGGSGEGGGESGEGGGGSIDPNA